LKSKKKRHPKATYAFPLLSLPKVVAGFLACLSGLSVIAADIPIGSSVGAPLTNAGGSLKGEYWLRPPNTIATDGNTNPTNRVDEQIKRFGNPSGTFTATGFIYLGNDLTPLATWLDSDAASFSGTSSNLDDGAFRFTGFVNVPAAGSLNIGVNADDGARIRIGGVDVIANDGGHGDQTADADAVFAAAGLYPIEITYFNGDWTSDGNNHSGNPDPGVHGGANFRLRIAGNNVTAADVARFFPTAPTNTGRCAHLARRRQSRKSQWHLSSVQSQHECDRHEPRQLRGERRCHGQQRLLRSFEQRHHSECFGADSWSNYTVFATNVQDTAALPFRRVQQRLLSLMVQSLPPPGS
jgi:hypothetical protein